MLNNKASSGSSPASGSSDTTASSSKTLVVPASSDGLASLSNTLVTQEQPVTNVSSSPSSSSVSNLSTSQSSSSSQNTFDKAVDEYLRDSMRRDRQRPRSPDRQQPLQPLLTYSWSPSPISLSSSGSGPSPKYLFKTPPRELPSASTPDKATTPLATPERVRGPFPTNSISVAHCSRTLASPEVRDPFSPDRISVAHGFKTPSRPALGAVESLSPVFERLEVKKGNKNYGRKKLPDSPLLQSPQLPDGPDGSGFLSGDTSKTSLSEQVTRTSLNQPTKRFCFSSRATSTTGLEDQDPVVSGVSVGTQTALYQPTEPIVLLIPEELSKAEQFARAFDAEIVVGEWQDRATHVIFDFCNKTVNTRAILRKKFLLKLSWLEDSLKAGLLLRPDDYQASLDVLLHSRTINNQSIVGLFTEYVFLFYEPFDQLGYDLKALLIYHGATVITKPSEFANHTDKTAICLVGEDRYHSNIHMMSMMVNVKYQWVIECLEAARLRSMKRNLFDTSVEVAKSAGIPENLLI